MQRKKKIMDAKIKSFPPKMVYNNFLNQRPFLTIEEKCLCLQKAKPWLPKDIHFLIPESGSTSLMLYMAKDFLGDSGSKEST